MGFLKIVKGQDRAEALLGNSFARDRLAHAYLFAGPSGVGRLSTALELAASWMCRREKDGYCGDCRDCRRIFEFQHPDVRFTIPMMGQTAPEDIAALFDARVRDGVTPLRLEGNTRISIDQIRELEERLSRKAFEDRGHIEVLLDADRMGSEAANALLKTLEEPPDDTVIILVSSRWSALLPTVRSRSHLVRFRRIGLELLTRILEDRLELEPEEARRLAMASDGRPGLGLLAGEEKSNDADEFGPRAVLSKLRECESAFGALSLASKVSTKLRSEGSLELSRSMQAFLHDLRRHGCGLVPLTRPASELEGFRLTPEDCSGAMEAFRAAENRLIMNVQARIALGAAFCNVWSRILKR